MISLIVLVLFPFVIWGAYKKIRLAKASVAWPTVPGVVTAAERIKKGWRAQPQVTFSYQVNGKNYSSSKVSFADLVPVSETEPILGRYPLSRPVTVHYKQEDPTVAVLETGSNRNVTALFRYYIYLFVVIILVNLANLGLKVWVANHASDTPQAPTYDDAAKADPQYGNKLIRESAEKGDAKDQVYVAVWYLTGTEGYAKDPAEGAKWLQKAAAQGNAEGENMLARLYSTGTGVEKDPVQALDLLKKAAAQGEPHACYSLGYAYEKGLGGLTEDKATAIEWYRKAGDEPHAKAALARLGEKD